MTINFSKPVQTRDGRKVRILCTDADCSYMGTPQPVVGIIEEQPPNTWSADGRFTNGDSSDSDLINVPSPKKRVTVEVRLHGYGDGVIQAQAKADRPEDSWVGVEVDDEVLLDSAIIEMEYEEQPS